MEYGIHFPACYDGIHGDSEFQLEREIHCELTMGVTKFAAISANSHPLTSLGIRGDRLGASLNPSIR